MEPKSVLVLTFTLFACLRHSHVRVRLLTADNYNYIIDGGRVPHSKACTYIKIHIKNVFHCLLVAGENAYPFFFELPPHCPASVTLQVTVWQSTSSNMKKKYVICKFRFPPLEMFDRTLPKVKKVSFFAMLMVFWSIKATVQKLNCLPPRRCRK